MAEQKNLFDFVLNYPIAKNHQLIQILPQFKPIKRGARKKGVERTYVSKDKKTKATIMMFKELDIADQDLLLTTLAIALPIKRGYLIEKTDTENGEVVQELFKKLELDGVLAQYPSIRIETTYYELLKELNKKITKQNYEWLFDSLKRLSATTIMLDTPKFIGSTNLLSFYFDKKTEKLNIAINPINALTLMGDNKGYILNNRYERLTLKNDTAKALHSVLLTLLNTGQKNIFNLDILIEKVYLKNIEEMNTNEKKNSRRTIKKALEKINELQSWEIEIYSNNTVSVHRKYELLDK